MDGTFVHGRITNFVDLFDVFDLFQKLEILKQEQMTCREKARWQQHWELERGNPLKKFKGEK